MIKHIICIYENSTTNIYSDSNISLKNQNINYNSSVQSIYNDTYYNKITGASTQIIEASNITIAQNMNEINNVRNISILDNTTEIYNKNSNIIVSGNMDEIVSGTSKITYTKDSTFNKALKESSMAPITGTISTINNYTSGRSSSVARSSVNIINSAVISPVNWPPQAGTINNHVKQQNLLCIPKDSYIKIDNIPTHNEHGGWLRTGGRGTLFLVIQTPETYTEDFNLLEYHSGFGNSFERVRWEKSNNTRHVNGYKIDWDGNLINGTSSRLFNEGDTTSQVNGLAANEDALWGNSTTWSYVGDNYAANNRYIFEINMTNPEHQQSSILSQLDPDGNGTTQYFTEYANEIRINGVGNVQNTSETLKVLEVILLDTHLAWSTTQSANILRYLNNKWEVYPTADDPNDNPGSGWSVNTGWVINKNSKWFNNNSNIQWNNDAFNNWDQIRFSSSTFTRIDQPNVIATWDNHDPLKISDGYNHAALSVSNKIDTNNAWATGYIPNGGGYNNILPYYNSDGTIGTWPTRYEAQESPSIYFHINPDTFVDTQNNANTLTISNNLNLDIQKSFSLTANDNISIKTTGGLNITTHQHRTLDFNGNTCIKGIKSFVPNIITTQQLFDANCISVDGADNVPMFTIDNVKTLNIISIKDINNLVTLYNQSDMFIKLKLPPGKYNGQICKIILHPQFETLFGSSIDQRIANNYLQEVIIRIESFVDAATNGFITADLILNRGGMSLNLIYISSTTNNDYLLTNDTKPYSELDNDVNNDDDDNNDVDDRGYWMLMDNNFDNTSDP